MSEPVIDVHGLTKRFKEVAAVDNIDLMVKEGEVFGFLGPNGAGKTTTIKMLCGILSPTSGRGRLLGLDILREREAIKRNIGYMAQHFGLYHDLTVRENLDFYSRIYGVRDKSYPAGLIEEYGLNRYSNTLSQSLSGGYRQRLALICALTHRPRLVFLDEPTAGVDPVTRKELWDLFYRLVGEGVTLFVTTHYMEEAERCSRIAFIFAGRIIVCDTPEAIRDHIGDVEVYEAKVPYSSETIARMNAEDDVVAVNQFGALLRIIVKRDVYDHAGILKLLGDDLPPETLRTTSPSIEDIFVTLTRREKESC